MVHRAGAGRPRPAPPETGHLAPGAITDLVSTGGCAAPCRRQRSRGRRGAGRAHVHSTSARIGRWTRPCARSRIDPPAGPTSHDSGRDVRARGGSSASKTAMPASTSSSVDAGAGPARRHRGPRRAAVAHRV